MLTRPGGAPTRTLVLVAALLAVVGGTLLWLGLSSPPQTPQDALEPVSDGATVQVTDDGFSLWSQDPDAWGSTVCSAEGTPLLRPTAAYSITVAGTEYHEVARSPRALLAGSYALTCAPEQTLYAGPHAERTAPSVLRGPLGVLGGGVLLGLALLTAVVALVAHRRQKRLEAFRVPAHRLDPSLRHQDDERPVEEPPAPEGRRAGRERRSARGRRRARGSTDAE